MEIEEIKQLSLRELILAMVEGLRNPTTKIDMGSFGSKTYKFLGLLEICHGCAATNALCNLLDIDLRYLKKNRPRVSENFEGKDASFICQLEHAYDILRQGNAKRFIQGLNNMGFNFPNSDNHPWLPYLTVNYRESELKVYEDFANSLT